VWALDRQKFVFEIHSRLRYRHRRTSAFELDLDNSGRIHPDNAACHVRRRYLVSPVVVARDGEESAHHLPLPREIDVRHRRRVLAAGRAGELPGCNCGASDDRGDVFERQVEHVMQDEGEPLGWGQCFEDGDQCQTDRFGQQDSCSGFI
jgi:hypothetical protein